MKKTKKVLIIVGIALVLLSLFLIIDGAVTMENGYEVDYKTTAIWSLTENKTYYKKTDDWYIGLCMILAGVINMPVGSVIIACGVKPEFFKKITNSFKMQSTKSTQLPSAAATQSNHSYISVADEIEKYKQLLDSGAITSEEYEQQKQKLIDSNGGKI